MTVGEIQAGIEITRDQDPAKAGEIERWLDQVCDTFNILNMDGSAFYEDAMIAAIAKVHQLTVVTRNVVDFSGFDVPLLNPFASGNEANGLGTSQPPVLPETRKQGGADVVMRISRSPGVNGCTTHINRPMGRRQANPPYSSSREITSRTRWALASLGSSWWQS